MLAESDIIAFFLLWWRRLCFLDAVFIDDESCIDEPMAEPPAAPVALPKRS